jgi:uncharacterized protein involved in outer membrane biogenesis
MRKLGVVLGIVGVVLVIALVLVFTLGNPNRHRAVIQAQLERQFGRQVTLGEMSLGLIPFRFQVENPVVAEDPRIGQTKPFVQAEKVDIRVSLIPLLRGNVQVDSIELQRPRVELIRTKAGTWNFSTFGPKTAPAKAETPGGSERTFSLAKLAIMDGQLGVTDLQKGTARAGYDHIDLALENYAPGMPFTFDLAAHIQGSGAQEIRFKGEGGPVSSIPAETPFRGDLTFKEVAIDGLLKFLDSKALPPANGLLSGETSIASDAGSLTGSGTLRLDKAQVNRLDIGYPIKVDYKLAARTSESIVTIEEATVLLGQTPIRVAGTVNAAGRVPALDLRVKSEDISIVEIARLASAFGVAFAPGTSVTGRVRADLRARGSSAKPELTGTVAGNDLRISGQGIPQPVQVKTVDVTLSPTAIRSNEFNATSGKTTVVGKFAIQDYASNSPLLDLGLRAPEATLPEIQSIAKAYGVTGLEQLTGEGSLNFDLQAKGPLQSLSSAGAAKALNGTLNLDFSPLRIAGFDAAHELAKVGGFASSLSERAATDIVRIIGRVLIKDGVAQSDNLKAQMSAASMAVSGTADLAAETLELKLSTVFSKEFSDKVRGVRGGNLMNTALANSGGEIVVPALVTGTFTRPKFAPDLKAVAQLQRQRLLPTLSNPGILGNVLGALGGKTEETADQPAEQKRDPVKSILDLFGRKKSPEQAK